jgi:hypothetical protein
MSITDYIAGFLHLGFYIAGVIYLIIDIKRNK